MALIRRFTALICVVDVEISFGAGISGRVTCSGMPGINASGSASGFAATFWGSDMAGTVRNGVG